jgi:hypothetical protein
MKRVIFFVLLNSVNLLLLSQNLIINPGFELWEKLNKPAGWTTAQNCLKDSANIRSGKYSCRHEGGTKYLGQTLSIVPGKKYKFSFFYKTEITGTGNGCRIWCYWKDGQGNNLSDPATDDLLRPSKYLKSESMQQFSVDLDAPSGASSIYLEVRTYQNSVAYFDDFVFEEDVATAGFEELLPNLMIYPNPSHDYLIISNMKFLKHIDIQSLAGNNVWSSDYSGEESVTIPVSGFRNGTYIINIRASGKLITRKFVKEAN